MSRHISVYRPEDFDPPMWCTDWRVRDDVGSLYDAPLGAEGDVYDWWFLPASKLGLPLIAAIYEYGFHRGICWHGCDLEQAITELSRLESHWLSLGLSANDKDCLIERSASLRKALDLAVSENGAVVIT